MMIVRNPPRDPSHLDLITQTPEHRAVEVAIRIARVPFECAATTEPSRWSALLRYHGEDATFVLNLPAPVSIAVAPSGWGADASEQVPTIVDGAQGVLELAALIAATAGPA